MEGSEGRGGEERKIEGKKLRKGGREGGREEGNKSRNKDGRLEEMTKGKEKGIGEPNFSVEGENIENKKELLFVTV